MDWFGKWFRISSWNGSGIILGNFLGNGWEVVLGNGWGIGSRNGTKISLGNGLEISLGNGSTNTSGNDSARKKWFVVSFGIDLGIGFINGSGDALRNG